MAHLGSPPAPIGSPQDERRELISQDALLWRIEPTIPSRSFIWHPAAKLPVRVVFERTTECLELPQEQTSVSASLMSANDPKQTLRERPNGRERVCSGFAINRYSVDDLSARGKPKVGAAQGFGGSDANVFHDRHGLDHRDVQWPYPIRRQVHHVARHRGRRLRQKYSNPAIL